MTSSPTVLTSLKEIVALCKRRGFIYPGSDIYGGFANTYSYGPYGAEMKKNIKDLWWKTFIHSRNDMLGLDGPILLHPTTWKASGHVDGFNDAMIDCKACKGRFRVDHLIEAALKMEVEGLSLEELDKIVKDNNVPCPKCGKHDFTPPRHFNLMFQTPMGKTDSQGNSIAYLRPETAQAIFLDFKNVTDSMRVKLPFGIGQIGKAFRNEITPGNFIFRVIEFEQMEIEYFIDPQDWENIFKAWLDAMHQWCALIGLDSSKVHEHEHPKEKLSHYSKRTVDLVYDFPFGRSELYGLAYRTDFDLSQHSQHSGKKLEYHDLENKRSFIPHVIEPTFGVDRTLLALLCNAYAEEMVDGEIRTVLRLHPRVAPVKVAILPLMKKEPLGPKARQVYEKLRTIWNVEYDESGAIGKRYRRQDEIGTPFCITIDYETIEDDTVTVRERDSMQQQRIALDQLLNYLADKLS
jgi:glycyl-tRNA synthetase